LSGKALRKELTSFASLLERDKPEFGSTVGKVMNPDLSEKKVDDFQTDKIRELGVRALEGQFARSAPEALVMAKQKYGAIERDVLNNLWFVPDGKTKGPLGWRLAVSSTRPDGSVPYNSDRVDQTLRIAGRNAAVARRFEEIKAREEAPKTAIKR
jgi:hypothetical protein